jgi:hypothetical protein
MIEIIFVRLGTHLRFCHDLLICKTSKANQQTTLRQMTRPRPTNYLGVLTH